MKMTDLKNTIEKANQGFISTKSILVIMVAIFIGVQLAFLVFASSDEMTWQISGWILSTNIAAVWLGVLGNMQVERARAASQVVYSADLLETLHWLTKLKLAVEKENEADIEIDEQINAIAPTLSKVIFRYYKLRDKIDRLAKIKNDEVFISAIEEVKP
jgi:hypothetical protein